MVWSLPGCISRLAHLLHLAFNSDCCSWLIHGIGIKTAKTVLMPEKAIISESVLQLHTASMEFGPHIESRPPTDGEV